MQDETRTEITPVTEPAEVAPQTSETEPEPGQVDNAVVAGTIEESEEKDEQDHRSILDRTGISKITSSLTSALRGKEKDSVDTSDTSDEGAPGKSSHSPAEQSVQADAPEGEEHRSILERTGVTKLASGIGGMFKGKHHDEEALAEHVRTWVTSASFASQQDLYQRLPDATSEFAGWLSGLPQEELISFIRKLDAFCAEQGFELEWVFRPELDEDRQLKRTLEGIVYLYCMSYWQVVQNQASIQAFARYLAWQSNPMSKENQELTRKVFPKLVQQKLIPEPTTEAFFFTEDEKRTYVVESVNKVADQNMPALLGILKEA